MAISTLLAKLSENVFTYYNNYTTANKKLTVNRACFFLIIKCVWSRQHTDQSTNRMVLKYWRIATDHKLFADEYIERQKLEF